MHKLVNIHQMVLSRLAFSGCPQRFLLGGVTLTEGKHQESGEETLREEGV